MSKKIDTLKPLTINGVEQWILMQSNDTSKPVLLVLHGGPGYAMMPLFHKYNAALEDHAIVVNWDQRGAGRSFNKRLTPDSLKFQNFLDDLDVLTQYLKQRFKRDNIFILGHSWGTMLGLHAAKSHPDDYRAFISVGQVVGPIINEIKMYEWILSQALRARDAKAIRELKMIGHPDKAGNYPGKGPSGSDPYDVAERWMGHFGGDLYGKRSTRNIDGWLLKQPVYEGKWGDKWEQGFTFSSKYGFDDEAAWNLDFRKTVRTLEIPVYFLQGHHDYDTPWPLVEAYAAKLRAPRKQLVWFEQSSHFPFYEESEKFNAAMIEVLNAG